MKRPLKITAALGLIIALGGATASAHTPYVLPNVFSTSTAKKLTVESSFTEEFFVPDFKVESDDFHLILPDGSRSEYGNVVMFDQVTILENALEEEGTYRLSTGDRLGRKFKMKRVEEGWDYVRRGEEGEPEVVPEGVETAEFQSQTVAVAYVSKGAPTATVLKQSGSGLEIAPITHPSEIYLDEGFEFGLTFNGKPLKGHEMFVYRQGGSYEEPEYEVKATTSKKGVISLTFDKPGVYVVMTRLQDKAPAGAETPYRSYTISLTFEVQR